MLTASHVLLGRALLAAPYQLEAVEQLGPGRVRITAACKRGKDTYQVYVETDEAHLRALLAEIVDRPAGAMVVPRVEVEDLAGEVTGAPARRRLRRRERKGGTNDADVRIVGSP
jgi:hypothetical protein